MTGLPSTFWQHDESCCGRELVVGTTYRKMSRNVLTGEKRGFRTYKVIEVEPIRHDRIICRWMIIERDDGERLKTQVANFWASSYETLDNVVTLHKTEGEGDG